MKITETIEIKNVSDYAKTMPFIVARKDETDITVYWFYGAWDSEKEANRVANELGDDARVFANPDM